MINTLYFYRENEEKEMEAEGDKGGNRVGSFLGDYTAADNRTRTPDAHHFNLKGNLYLLISITNILLSILVLNYSQVY